jgi:hypothetical protein
MDDADLTERQTEITGKASLHQSRKPEPEGPATGQCWFCGDDVEPGRRWCSKACCDDWQTENT